MSGASRGGLGGVGVALRELRRQPARFAPVLAALALLAVLTILFSGLLDGLSLGGSAALRELRVDLIVLDDSAQGQIGRSRVPDDVRQTVAATTGVAETGALAHVRLPVSGRVARSNSCRCSRLITGPGRWNPISVTVPRSTTRWRQGCPRRRASGRRRDGGRGCRDRWQGGAWPGWQRVGGAGALARDRLRGPAGSRALRRVDDPARLHPRS